MNSIPLISHRMFVAAVVQERPPTRRGPRQEHEAEVEGQAEPATLDGSDWWKAAAAEPPPLRAPAERERI